MRTGRSEALDIFLKWKEEGRSIKVQASFPLFAFGFLGHISQITPKDLYLINAQTHSELVLRLDESLEYGYGDNRNITGEEKRFEESLMIFFPQIDLDNPTYIILGALEIS